MEGENQRAMTEEYLPAMAPAKTSIVQWARRTRTVKTSRAKKPAARMERIQLPDPYCAPLPSRRSSMAHSVAIAVWPEKKKSSPVSYVTSSVGNPGSCQIIP